MSLKGGSGIPSNAQKSLDIPIVPSIQYPGCTLAGGSSKSSLALCGASSSYILRAIDGLHLLLNLDASILPRYKIQFI